MKKWWQQFSSVLTLFWTVRQSVTMPHLIIQRNLLILLLLLALYLLEPRLFRSICKSPVPMINSVHSDTLKKWMVMQRLWPPIQFPIKSSNLMRDQQFGHQIAIIQIDIWYIFIICNISEIIRNYQNIRSMFIHFDDHNMERINANKSEYEYLWIFSTVSSENNSISAIFGCELYRSLSARITIIGFHQFDHT